jgi:GAF domain-containing protein
VTNGDIPSAMEPTSSAEPTTDTARALRLVVLARLLTWLGIALIGYASFRGQSGLAWQAPAFALLYNLPVLLFSGRETRSRLAYALDIATDLIAATVLITATGGFASPFLPLSFLAVVEGAMLLGAAGGLWVAVCAAALNLVHLRLGAQPSSLLILVLNAGLLTLLAVSLRRIAPPAPQATPDPPETVLQRRTIEDVEAQVEELERQNRLLRANYQEVAAVARKQQAKMAQHQVVKDILQAGLDDGGEEALNTRILRALMGALQARGAALWLLDPGGEKMRAAQIVGQVAPLLKERAVPVAPESQPSEIRRACEERLRESAPLPAANPFSLTGEEKPPAGSPAVLSVSLRDEQGFLGVIGLCAPAEGRFEEEDSEVLTELAGCAAMAVRGIQERTRLRRSARESALLLEVSRRAQMAESADQVGAFLIEAAAELTACENATLFLLEADNQKLNARATRGLPVNLMDHIPFERGTGISGWVAQERKQLYIPDLTRETRLLNVELIPPRVRSFLSVPMTARDRVIGVLNISHSRPDAFTPEHMRLLTTLAGQAALAIEQSERARAAE